MSNQRSPAATNVTLLDEVRTMLRAQEAAGMAGALGSVVAGALVCLGMGVVVASLMTIILLLLAHTTLIGWTGWFGVYVLVLVPLLIWQERRTRQDYVSDAVSTTDPSPSSRGEHEVDKARIQIAFLASALVWGPRRLIDGARGLRGQRTFAARAVSDRAAQLVADLFKSGIGVPIKDLMHPPEQMHVFMAAVEMLDKHGWIGKATDGNSMWLGSTFRKKLLERMREIKAARP